MITSKGEEEPPLWLRIFWALACGGVAGCLLLAGGLEAVQAAAVIAAFPLSILMLLMCYGILKGLRGVVALPASRNLPTAPLMAGQGGLALRKRQKNIHQTATQTRAIGEKSGR